MNATHTTPDGTRSTIPKFEWNLNLSYHRARYYDPSTGRFLSEDRIDFRVAIDLYNYVKNNPLSFTDPRGLAPVPSDPQLPTTPTGKAGCYFVGEIPSSPCKVCMYRCRGYGAIVTFPQATGKQCPSIDPISGLVNTNEIDPGCRPDQSPPCKKKIPVPDPTPLLYYILIFLLLRFLTRAPLPA
jgi:RHS repeat-associated protein